MFISEKFKKKNKTSIIAIGLLFTSLGSTLQSETSWLFILGGTLILIQCLYDKFRFKNKNNK
jgi:hypothetical protein